MFSLEQTCSAIAKQFSSIEDLNDALINNGYDSLIIDEYFLVAHYYFSHKQDIS